MVIYFLKVTPPQIEINYKNILSRQITFLISLSLSIYLSISLTHSFSLFLSLSLSLSLAFSLFLNLYIYITLGFYFSVRHNCFSPSSTGAAFPSIDILVLNVFLQGKMWSSRWFFTATIAELCISRGSFRVLGVTLSWDQIQEEQCRDNDCQISVSALLTFLWSTFEK